MSDLRYLVAPLDRVLVRDPSGTDDNTWTMSGYAAVFNADTTLYDSQFVQINERIDPAAFNVVMRDQPMDQAAGVVHFNFGHDMNRAVAATNVPAGQPGSLKLTVDDNGLRFMAKVPRDDPDGVALAAKMRSGVVSQASFAFTVGSMDTMEHVDDETGKVFYSDTLTEVDHLYDVCACAQGAYSQTVSGLRMYASQLGQPAIDAGGHQRQPPAGGVNIVSQAKPGGDVELNITITRSAIRAMVEPHRSRLYATGRQAPEGSPESPG